MLFKEATVLNDFFFGLLEEQLEGRLSKEQPDVQSRIIFAQCCCSLCKPHSSKLKLKAHKGENADVHCSLCKGPIKHPDRAFQKLARKYYFDARHLTDLVRCCILVDSISDVRDILDRIFERSRVFGSDSNQPQPQGPRGQGSPAAGGGGGGGQEKEQKQFFKLCKVKDEFSDDKSHGVLSTGYRYICLNLEVGWSVESESYNYDKLDFVSVQDFGRKHVRTHICEVQILLKSMHELKINGCHDSFVKRRNVMTN